MHTLKVSMLILFLLFLILASGIFSYHILETSAGKIENQLQEVEVNVFSGDWGKAKTQMELVDSDWKKTSKIWAAFIDHIEIDNIDTSLAKTEKYILSKDSSLFFAEIATLKLFIKHIPEKETLNLENIL